MRPLQRLLSAQALRDNWRAVRQRAAAANIMAAVKSRAYGHGLRFVAHALRDVADGFCVVDMKDAAALRDMQIETPILLMSGIFCDEEITRAVRLRLWLAVHNERQVRQIIGAPCDAQLTVLVKVDVGMNRLGFLPAQAATIMDELMRAPSVAKVGLMAHFAAADSQNGIRDALTLLQPLRQKAALVSLGNSAALLLQGDIQDDWGRAGISLYGSSPAPAQYCSTALGLRPVMTLKTSLIAVRHVRAGAAVGYGGTWRAPQDMRIGIAAAGYGDGYPRADNLWTQVLGQKAAVLGRVSMELIALDLRNCTTAEIDDEVVLWGQSPHIDEIAAAAGRISYELLVSAGGVSVDEESGEDLSLRR